MNKVRQSSYPMAAEEREDLARELEQFGYRETDDPDEADRRNFYKVEKWDAGDLHVYSTRSLRQRKGPCRAHPRVEPLSHRAGCGGARVR
jgi:hypothetical protein